MKKAHVLIVLFLIAAYILTFQGTPYLRGYDSWYHYRMSESIVEQGARPEWDTMLNAPQGTKSLYPPLLHSFIASFSLTSGLNTFFMAQIYPFLLSAVILCVVFLIAREFFDEKVALLSAAFMFLLPKFLSKTQFGMADHDALSFLLFLCAVFFFIKSLKKRVKTSYKMEGRMFKFHIYQLKPRYLTYSILSGTFFGAFALTWYGFPLFLVIISAFVIICSFINPFFKIISKEFVYSFCISSFLGLGIASIFYGRILPLFIVTCLTAFISVISYKLQQKPWISTTVIISVLLISTAFVLTQNIPVIETGLEYVGIKEKALRLQEVSELQKPTLETFSNMYGLLPLLLFSFGLFFFIITLFTKKINIFNIFFILWFCIFAFMAASALRFTLIFSMFIAIFTSLFIVKFSGYLDERMKKNVFPIVSAVVLICALGTVFFTPMSMPTITDNWYNALVWLKSDSSEHDVILNWWDYSPWINAVSERGTVVNNQPRGRFGDMAMFFGTIDWAKAEEILLKYNVSYVVVNMDMSYIWRILEKYSGETLYFGILPTTLDGNVQQSLREGYSVHYDRQSNMAWVRNEKGVSFFKDIGYYDVWLNKTTYIIYTEEEIGYNTTDDFLYVWGDNFLYINNKSRDNIYLQLMFMPEKISFLELRYENPEIKIYKVI